MMKSFFFIFSFFIIFDLVHTRTMKPCAMRYSIRVGIKNVEHMSIRFSPIEKGLDLQINNLKFEPSRYIGSVRVCDKLPFFM